MLLAGMGMIMFGRLIHRHAAARTRDNARHVLELNGRVVNPKIAQRVVDSSQYVLAF
jgi:hypothetical protein